MGDGHGLILGPTKCGKSTLAHAIAKDYQTHGVNSLVFDPHMQSWPVPSQHQFTDLEKFLAVARRSQRCALFIEEAGEALGRGRIARQSQWITTGSRKWGHTAYLLAQEAQQLLPVIRSCCARGFIFRQSKRNAEMLVNDFADERLMQATTLGRFEFLYAEKMGDVRLMKLPG